MAVATDERSAERLSTVPASKEVRTYEEGLRRGKEEAKKGEDKGFITTLLDDLFELIDKAPNEKRKQLTAQTKTPTRETVIDAFDAANDVTAGATEAHKAYKAGDTAEAIRLQRKAEAEFLAKDPLVREGAMLVLYIRAELEYRAIQDAAGYTSKENLELAA